MPDPNAPDQAGTPALFALPGAAAKPKPARDLSPGARWAARVRMELDGGLHPLGIGAEVPLRLHPQAAPVGDRRAAGRRCGSCLFRQIQRMPGGRRVPKCVAPVTPVDGGPARPARATHSPRTDCEAWWPACTDHQFASAALRAAEGQR
jgi:hypothetical protein